MNRKTFIAFAFLLLMAISSYAWALGNVFRIEPTGFLNEDLVLFLYDTQKNNENMALNSGALAAATDDVTIASAVNYIKNGVFGQVAAGEITMAGATQEINTTKLYVFTYNTTTATTEITIGTAGETDIKNIVLPAGNIPFGYVKVVATAEYVPGTTTWATSGITETFYNLAYQPSKCRVSNTSR